MIYSLKDGAYKKLTDFGWVPFWLSDGQRLVFASEGKTYLMDSVSLETRLVLSMPPPATIKMMQLTPHRRHLVYMRSIDESDIWMMELTQEAR